MTLLTMSADSHVTEPGDCYLDRIDPAFRDRAPRAVTDDTMGAVLLIDEGASRIPYGMVAAAGRPPEKIGPFEFVDWDELHQGGWDPVARLAEQDRDGVAAEVLYPSAGMLICNLPDADSRRPASTPTTSGSPSSRRPTRPGWSAWARPPCAASTRASPTCAAWPSSACGA